MRPPPLRLLVVLAALGAVVAVGSGVPQPDVGTAAPAQVAVVGGGAVCADLRQQPGAVRTEVAAGVAEAAVPAAPEADLPAPAVSSRRLGGEPAPDPAEPPTDLPLPAEAAVVTGLGTDLDGAALAVRATGSAAAGLAAQSTALVTAGPVRGLAVARCGAASPDRWLLGGGTTVGESAVLLLVNPDLEPAVVDVTVLSAEGTADARPGRGLTVPALGQLAVPLDVLAPERSRLAVRVQAVRGRVASAVRHERSDGVVPRGVAYAAAAADGPAEQVTVPGLPQGPGGRAVWVTNPGDVDVEVAVEVTTLEGQFVPDGLDALAVPAGSSVAADLSEVLGTTPAAVRVAAAGGPVLAVGVAEDTGEGDVRDLAYVGPAPALRGAGLLPDVLLGAAEHTVLLSALAGDAVVELSFLPVAGQPGPAAPPRRVDVPGGRTVAVPVGSLLPEGAGGRVAVQVRPDPRGSGAHVGVVVRARPAEGPLLAGYALTAPAATAVRPQVVRDPAVGAGTG
ncbi:MAG TPA: DUF5719 family protein [Mycobacteriales bacterium]|nr:DUF5719 family protein [Mycobacteriales bacterium]